MIESKKIPAGKHWVGDPCYAFPQGTPADQAWMPCLESANFRDDPRILEAEAVVDGRTYRFVASGTAYGDGVYSSAQMPQVEFPVDAGLIGVVPASQVEGEPFGMTLVDFAADFTVGYEKNGTIHIGEIEIFTGDDPEDDWEDDAEDWETDEDMGVDDE